jgi:hypothetical protein
MPRAKLVERASKKNKPAKKQTAKARAAKRAVTMKEAVQEIKVTRATAREQSKAKERGNLELQRQADSRKRRLLQSVSNLKVNPLPCKGYGGWSND